MNKPLLMIGSCLSILAMATPVLSQTTTYDTTSLVDSNTNTNSTVTSTNTNNNTNTSTSTSTSTNTNTNVNTSDNTNTNYNINSGSMTNNNINTNTSTSTNTNTNYNYGETTTNTVLSGSVTYNNNNNTVSNNTNTNINTSTSTATNYNYGNTTSNINSAVTSNNTNTNVNTGDMTNRNINTSTSTSNSQVTSNNNNVNVNDSKMKVIQPPPTAIAPSMMSGGNNDLCTTGISGAAQTQILGISVGSTKIDQNCERLKLSKTLFDMGMKVAAVATLCQDRRVFDAMLAAGTPCPYEGEIGAKAKALWEQNPDKAPKPLKKKK